MGKIIRLTESDLHRIIKESAERVLQEAFDASLVDGIDSIDMRTLRKWLMDFFGDYKSRKTPYYGIKELVHYLYDSEKLGKNGKPIPATYKKVQGGGRIFRAIQRDGELTSLFNRVMQLDKKLTDIALNCRGSQTQIVDEVSWNVDEMVNTVNKIIKNRNLNDILSHYSDDAGATSIGGKQRSLGRIMLETAMSLDKVQRYIKKLKAVVDNSGDPMRMRY